MPPQSDGSKIYIIVLMIALLISGFNLVRAQSFEGDIANARSKLYDVNKELETFKEVKSKLEQVAVMGKGLEYVFEKEVAGLKFNDGWLFMSPNGDSKKFTVKRTYNFPLEAGQLSRSLSNSKYGTRICKDIKLSSDGLNSNDEVEIKITSGSSKGYDIFRFTNKKTKETAYVLIMVEDTKK